MMNDNGLSKAEGAVGIISRRSPVAPLDLSLRYMEWGQESRKVCGRYIVYKWKYVFSMVSAPNGIQIFALNLPIFTTQ